MPVHDSIKIVTLGFEPITVKLDSVRLLSGEDVIIPLKRASFVLNNVDVNLRRGFFDLSSNDTISNELQIPEGVMSGLGNIVDIREVMALQRAESGTFGITPGTIMMIVRFFKKIKRRKQASISKYNNEHLKELTSLQNISLFTGFQEAKLDSFVIFLEKHYTIDSKLSDYEIMKVVKKAYEEFIAMNK